MITESIFFKSITFFIWCRISKGKSRKTIKTSKTLTYFSASTSLGSGSEHFTQLGNAAGSIHGPFKTSFNQFYFQNIYGKLIFCEFGMNWGSLHNRSNHQTANIGMALRPRGNRKYRVVIFSQKVTHCKPYEHELFAFNNKYNYLLR
jgi:hypothetical protein